MEFMDFFWAFTSLSVDTSGIFDSLYSTLMTDLMVPLSNKFNSVIAFIKPIFTFAFGLFIMMFGYMILSGRIKAPAQEFVWRMACITLVFWAVFSPTIYERFVIKPVVGTTTGVSKLLSPSPGGSSFFPGTSGAFVVGQTNEDLYNNNRGLFVGLDVAIESVAIALSATVSVYNNMEKIIKKNNASPAAKANDEEVIEQGLMTSMLVVGFVGLIITGAVMIYVTAGAILMLNHVFLILMLMVGPAFIAMSVYKPTREHAKKWLQRLLGICLTIAIVSAMVAFILFIQKDISGQMCEATGTIQEAFIKKMNKNVLGQVINNKIVKDQLKRDFKDLEKRVKKALSGGGSQVNAQKSAALAMVSDIKKACKLDSTTGIGGVVNEMEDGVNIMFSAIQYLIVCMVLNRLLTESANIAAAIVGSSGITTGTSQEVSGGAQGMSGRVGQSAGGASGPGPGPGLK